MERLLDRENASLLPVGWKREAFLAFHQKMINQERKFPCIPAIQGYQLNHIRFGFAPAPEHEKAPAVFARLLESYGSCSRETGDYSALVVFFHSPSGPGAGAKNVAAYENIFWDLMIRTHKMDKEPWPVHISPDPEDRTWEFCFGQEQYFVYCGTPAHERRYSRYFPCFMLALTPRWVLSRFNEDKKRADKMSDWIRSRLLSYDTAPIHPELKKYGDEDNKEWKQYYLRDNETAASVCPFHHLRGNGPQPNNGN
ncbi:YqcI/YcgG family protein [Fictibacillus terranigra]|uniref:YqcI/YcgG family protein n=1 Tax=Fictibacillus terranigra TaxID=3058424 RepID=A0ABT8E6H8_9BACL|nr:YqcI/YcgG family protein [Fictibacillus sp. CENA-BCM004]MDN4073515.1 YqcI/YcgG family protein [Fictibacillus sp. CENA-BCM004]